MVLGVSPCQYREVPPAISFSGSGFMATYQLGVAQCLLTYAPWILQTAPRVLGASAGSLVAAAVVCEMSPITIRDELLHFAKQMKAFTLGPLNPSVNIFHWLGFVLGRHLPADAHKLASGRLAVSTTRLLDGQHIVISEYQSRDDVLQALLCSCFVPGYCGMLPPSFKGEYYMDGGFTSMQPVAPQPCSPTLTVSPFSGEVDICPADSPAMWDMVVSGCTLKGNVANTVRIFNALYPLALDTLEHAYHSGYKDAIHFLLTHDLVPYLMISKLCGGGNGPPNFSTTSTMPDLERVMEEDEEEEKKKMERKTGGECVPLTNFTDCTPTSHQAADTTHTTTTTTALNASTEALMADMMSYIGVSGRPAKILSVLLLPLLLSVATLHQSKHRVEVIFSKASELAFWGGYGIRQFTFFFSAIVVGTIKKNLKDRVSRIPTVVTLLRWLKDHRKYEQQHAKRPPPKHRRGPQSPNAGEVKRLWGTEM